MDALLHLAESVISSPWLYLVVVVAVAIDAVIPMIPGETIVITAGAYAAVQAAPEALPLVVAALIGALAGDLVAHHIGRGAGPVARQVRRLRIGATLFDWAEKGLLTRGGALIIGARFIPGGRTATTIASGVVRFPRPQFVLFALIASVAWSIYYVGIGMVGGLAFREQPLLGVGIGIGLALVVGIAAERIRLARERRADRAGPECLSAGAAERGQSTTS